MGLQEDMDDSKSSLCRAPEQEEMQQLSLCHQNQQVAMEKPGKGAAENL